MTCEISPSSEHLGAEVLGVDLSQPVDEEPHEQLNRAFTDYAALAIREQSLTTDQMLFAVQLFCETFPQRDTDKNLSDK